MTAMLITLELALKDGMGPEQSYSATLRGTPRRKGVTAAVPSPPLRHVLPLKPRQR